MLRILGVVVVLTLLMVVVVPAAAQEPDPTAPNRANIILFVEYIKNRNLPALMPLVNAEDYIGHTPFAPEGGHSSIQEMIDSEIAMNAAFDLDYTRQLVLAEGNLTALIGFQEADFTGELFGTAPTGEHYGGNILFISEYENGLCTRDIEVWNQIDFMQFMGWAPKDYTFQTQPWAVSLGQTSTTPAEHHQMLQAMWDGLANGDAAPMAAAYAAEVVTHDFLGTVNGAEATSAMYSNLAALPGFTVERSGIVCEGDLCATGAVTYVDASDSADEDGRTYILWTALHRFVDGKIIEEWWMYDNAALWAVLPPAA